MSKIILYQMPISHYCEKVRWALDFKGLEYKTVNLLPGMHVKKAIKLTGKSSLPILQHGKKIIRNSADIISYLDTAFPEKTLTPQDPDHRTEALQWEKWLDSQVGPDVRRLVYHHILSDKATVMPMFCHQGSWLGGKLLSLKFGKLEKTMRKLMKIDDAQARLSQQRIEQAIDKIAVAKKQKSFLAGGTFSRADLAAAALLAPLRMPAGYPIPWPEKLPAGLADFVDAQAEKLVWLDEHYENFRGEKTN